ncbi:hypothetical protein SAMN05444172_9033 [Burkholderia sp. GAS332]|nr:hypothetical protein SAMN05444172_9033 [Burkholderia sp. GAS332]
MSRDTACWLLAVAIAWMILATAVWGGWDKEPEEHGIEGAMHAALIDAGDMLATQLAFGDNWDGYWVANDVADAPPGSW